MERLLVSAPAAGIGAVFPLDSFTQHRLFEGLDDIGLTLQFAADIDAYGSPPGVAAGRAGLSSEPGG